jgi:UDP-glucose 4-epimerase
VVGDGTQTRDFVYVTDIAQAFLAAARTDLSGERFNVGAGNPQPVNKLVEILGGDVVHIPKRPGEPDCTWANIEKIQRVLGWRPTVPFEEGVRRMLADIELWRDAPLWDPESIARSTEKWFRYLGERRG